MTIVLCLCSYKDQIEECVDESQDDVGSSPWPPLLCYEWWVLVVEHGACVCTNTFVKVFLRGFQLGIGNWCVDDERG